MTLFSVRLLKIYYYRREKNYTFII